MLKKTSFIRCTTGKQKALQAEEKNRSFKKAQTAKLTKLPDKDQRHVHEQSVNIQLTASVQ